MTKRVLGYLGTVLVFAGIVAGMVFGEASGRLMKGHREIRKIRLEEWTSGRSRHQVLVLTAEGAAFGAALSIAGCTYLEWLHRRAQKKSRSA